MATTIGNSTVYKVGVPTLTDPADIQTAFKLYHYGSETVPSVYNDIVTSESGNIGVAGHLKNLNTLKAPIDAPTFTGTVSLPSTTSIGNVSSTELSYLDGVTSGIQAQINTLAPRSSPTFVGSVTLPANTVIAATIASDAVTTAKILNLNVTTDKIAAVAITAPKIADSAVTNSKIIDLAVTNAKIDTPYITVTTGSGDKNIYLGATTRVGDSSALAKLDLTSIPVGNAATADTVVRDTNTTKYELLIQTNTNITDFVSLGNNAGYLLKSNGTDALPTWTDPSQIAALTATKLVGGATNQIVYQSSANNTAFLSVGTSGQILKAGTSGALSWITPADATDGITAKSAINTVAYSAASSTYNAPANKLYVGSIAPASPTVGDIWMW